MLSRGKPEPVFTSIKSIEVYQITAIWPNHYFGGGVFSCTLYQSQTEKFNLWRIFSVCCFWLWTLEHILNSPNREIQKKTINALRIAPVAPLILAERPRGWHLSSNGEGCSTAIAWHGLEKCTAAARQMGREGKDMGWWSPHTPSSGAWLVWEKQHMTWLYLTHISSPHGVCWEAGIWKSHREKMTALLPTKLLSGRLAKKQDAGNHACAGSEGVLFKHLVLLFPTDSQFGAVPRVKRQVTVYNKGLKTGLEEEEDGIWACLKQKWLSSGWSFCLGNKREELLALLSLRLSKTLSPISLLGKSCQHQGSCEAGWRQSPPFLCKLFSCKTRNTRSIRNKRNTVRRYCNVTCCQRLGEL